MTSEYIPTPQSHSRRGSVVDIAADLVGPSGHIWLNTIREYTSVAEDKLDTVSRPLRPYLPALGRFLIVVTFLEDALRILTQSTGEYLYLCTVLEGGRGD